METQSEILQLLQNYIKKYPLEQEGLKRFVHFVNQHKGEQLIDRKNFTGHITASAFIVNNEANRLLLLKHKALNRWLQPGGHVDATDPSLMAAAIREALEETGISATDLNSVYNTVFDFDSHFIPANDRKHEPGHYHHDVRFLFKCSHPAFINIAQEESTDSNWVPFAQLVDNEDFGRIVQKIQERREPSFDS